MKIVVIGAGPVGTTAALLLARDGHRVELLDRDPGPTPGSSWERAGIMQWHQPHTFRTPGHALLQTRLPDVHQALLDAGGLLVTPTGAPPFLTNVHLRRPLLDEALWNSASAEPGITRVCGHADALLRTGDRITGVLVDGIAHHADLVVDASGRAGQLGHDLRPEAEGGDCGFAYASRLYQLHAGAEPGPCNGGPGYVSEHLGFLTLIFTHDAGTFSVLVVRDSKDTELAQLREESFFDAVLAQLPAATAWTDPARSRPIGPVRVGAGLTNRYRGQARTVTGLLAIGDAVCTTNPVAGRGIALGTQTAAALADVVRDRQPAEWADALEDWCTQNLRPWFEAHLAYDAWTHRQWAGLPVDPDEPLAWSVVAAAAEQHPEFMAVVGPFLGMMTLPGSLEVLHDQVREMIRDGWQPAQPSAPSRDELLAAVTPVLTAT